MGEAFGKKAPKKKLAMAYAFSHQWRANSNQQGMRTYVLGKANWGWSRTKRWIAARPWESRVPVKSISSKKAESKQLCKVGKNINLQKLKVSGPVKLYLSNGKASMKTQRWSYPAAEKAETKKEQVVP